MSEGIQGAERTLAILSNAYLMSVYGQAEWQAAYRGDPHGFARKLIPVRIQECARPGLLGEVVSFDLFDLPVTAARNRLITQIGIVLAGRAKPFTEPAFPGGAGTVADPASPAVRVPPGDGGPPDHAGKYRALWTWLRNQGGDRLPMTFAEIEKVIGMPLPPSSRKYPAHWSGYEGSAVVRAIRDAGWAAMDVDIPGERLVFVRNR